MSDSYQIRPATDDERERYVRSTWRRSFAKIWRKSTKAKDLSKLDSVHVDTPLGKRDMIVLRGSTGARLDATTWLDAHERIVEDHLRHCDVLVAASGDQCVGWAAWDRSPLYVYVEPRCRRMGVGSDLLGAMLAHTTEVPMYLTYEGELLLASWQQRQSPPPPAAEPRALDS